MFLCIVSDLREDFCRGRSMEGAYRRWEAYESFKKEEKKRGRRDTSSRKSIDMLIINYFFSQSK